MFFVKNTNMTEEEREDLLDKSDWLCSYKLGDVYVFTIDNIKFIIIFLSSFKIISNLYNSIYFSIFSFFSKIYSFFNPCTII